MTELLPCLRKKIEVDLRLNKFGLRNEQWRGDLTSAVTCCCFSFGPDELTASLVGGRREGEGGGGERGVSSQISHE